MSFILEVRKNGKDIILFNNNKYRESYAVKCGDLVWRCLGKSCKAYVRTNPEKTAIYSSNEVHSGQHPVTMRALTPSLQRRCPLISTPVVNTDLPSLPCVSTPTSTPNQNQASQLIELTQEASAASPSISCISPPPSTDLQAENLTLKEELAKLRFERQAVLDHSIESDLRLLQYTETVFLPPPNLSISLTEPSLEQHNKNNNTPEESRSRQEESSVKEELERAVKKIQELENKQVEFNRPCETCIILREEINNMIGSLRSLEEEILQLKNQISPQPPVSISDSLRATQPALKLQNKFEVLNEEGYHSAQEDEGFAKVKNKKKKTHKKSFNYSFNHRGVKRTLKPNHDKVTQVSIPFSKVTIIGDSHVRNLASLMMDQVREGPAISGVCKPGAGLMSIMPTTTPCRDHCYVIMAGTNDVDAGRGKEVLKHLEDTVEVCKKWSRVLVLSLPTRYDLSPTSPVHNTVRLFNNHMAELCRRHENVKMLDISSIARHHHTAHGLHLRARGKRLMARLIVEKMALWTPLRSTQPSLISGAVLPATSPPLTRGSYAEAVIKTPTGTSRTLDQAIVVSVNNIVVAEPAVSAAVSSVPPGPDGSWTLPFDSYAEAARSTSPPPLTLNGRSADIVQTSNNSVFLGTPL